MNIFFNILRKYFKEILIVGLIVVILLMRACSGDSSIDPKDIVTVDGKDYELLEQKIDTVFIEKTIEDTWDQSVHEEGYQITKDLILEMGGLK